MSGNHISDAQADGPCRKTRCDLTTSVSRLILDSLGFGILLWIVGLVIGISLTSDFPGVVGWIVVAVLFPLSALVAYGRLRNDFSWLRTLLVATAWAGTAIVLDLTFVAPYVGAYYDISVYAYYLGMFLVPLAIAASTKIGKP